MLAGAIELSRQLHNYLDQYSGYIGPDGSICNFDGLTDRVPKQSEFRFHQLPECLFAHIEVEVKTMGGLYSFNTYKPGATRGESGVDEVYAMVYDFDDLPAGFDPQTFFASFPGAPMIVYSTHSHTPEKPKYRVILFLASPISAKYYKEVWTVLSARFTVKVDTAPSSAASIFFLPSCKPGAERVLITQSIANRAIQAEPFDWTVIFYGAEVKPEAPAPVLHVVKSNLYEPASSAHLAQRCAVIREAFETGGRHHGEPLWFGVLRCVAKAEPDITVEVSDLHPKFSIDELTARLERIDRENLKPVTCNYLADHSPLCSQCDWRGFITSPMKLAFDRLPKIKREVAA